MTSNEQDKRAFSGAPASSGRSDSSAMFQGMSPSRYVTPAAVPQHNQFFSSGGDQSDPSKRTRTDSDDLYSCSTETTNSSSLNKKSRQNDYIAPRKIPTTFTSTMGSLVGGDASALPWNGGEGNRRIHLRKQLSGSKLEGFLSSEADAMDVDASEPRPRSMSFWSCHYLFAIFFVKTCILWFLNSRIKWISTCDHQKDFLKWDIY